MLFLLSPAKALDFATPAHVSTRSEPLFVERAAELIAVLRAQSPQQIAHLMGLSDPLAGRNVARYQAWQPQSSAQNAKQAVLAFNGDVYGGLDAKTLNAADLDWLQQHLCILSGLYGVLRPLDAMQPYRLEMGTRLASVKGENLYQFWGAQIANYLDQRAAADISPVLINLASQEYFKAVDQKALKTRVVHCVFEERKAKRYQVIGVHAKRARGLMLRYAVQQRAHTPEQLKGFAAAGYSFAPAASELGRLVFRREHSA
ncbi:peroxide stress protein YaaA [Hydrogenophaga sp.]|uniref:peroxide stress protein YaaA n=1 Tax=Hydrogenophaga sp. TaxID=1904254 RepID=UPI0019BFC4E1|nr:peroxide stress protein YaaA [Hydrogenophaga sp.]MBD3892796.1 peroxide stress protein YaaA [Hydrogenophaga sp.]